MGYTEATALLRDTLETLAIPYRVETGSSPKGVGDTLRDEIARAGWVSSPSMPWFCDDVEFFPLGEMEKRQSGGGKDWDSGRYIFGLTYKNLLSIDRAGGVSIASHETGKWVYEELTDTLPVFLDVYGRYLRWFAFDKGGVIDNDDFVVSEATVTEIKSRFLSKLSALQAEAYLRFLLPDAQVK